MCRERLERYEVEVFVLELAVEIYMVLGLAGLASDVLRSDKLFVNRKYTQLISYHIAMSSEIRAYYTLPICHHGCVYASTF